MTAFSYKGYGRIYTNPENIQEVENIIKELNEFEWDYYPGNLVASWDAYPSVVWIGKFELDEYLFNQSCKARNIPVFVFDSEDEQFPPGALKVLTQKDIKAMSMEDNQ